MELIKVIEERTSIRHFIDEPVDLDDIKEMVRLAGLAPSINNYQPWKYYIIINKELLDLMASEVTLSIASMPESQTRVAKLLKNQVAWFSTFFREAPALVALAGKPYETDIGKGVTISHEELNRIRNYPDLQSAGASIQNFLLAATAKGYGTCWMSGPLFAREKLEEILKIEKPWSLITFIALGKPGKKQPKRTKRDISKEMIILD